MHLASLWLTGCCATAGTGPPAAIMDSTPAGRADIARAIAAALGTEVLIADDALTTSSILTIERRARRTMEGRVGSGRVLDSPEVFQLLLDDDRCVLAHLRTGESYPLENARCRPSLARPGNAPQSNQTR